MATLLRYVRYLRQNCRITTRINVNQSLVESNFARLKLHNQRVTNITRNFSTRNEYPIEAIYGFEKSFQNLEVQLRRSGKTNKADIERILGEIQLAGNVPSLEALLLIRCCGRPLMDVNSADGIKLVQEVWDTLEGLKVPMDVSHYNALLSVYLDREHLFSPAEFLQMMMAKDIVPNRVTYHRLIEGYCRRGDIANATKIIDVMRANNLPLCEKVYNSLIVGHSEAKDIKTAESILETMRSAGIEPSADTYATLLCAYAKIGDMASVEKTIEGLNSLEITLLEHHLMDIIKSFATSGHADKAVKFSQKLPKEITQDIEVGRLVAKLMEVKQIDLALEILKNTSSDTTRRQVRATFVLRAAATGKLFTGDELISLCNRVEAEGLHPKAFSVMVYHVLSQNPSPSVALPLMKAWKERGEEMREHYFWPLLRDQTRDSNYQGILDVLKSMVNDFKVTPSVDTLRDYTIPFMFGTWDSIIDNLTSVGIDKSTILQAIVHRSLIDKKLRNAVLFMRSYPTKFSKDLFLEPMAASLNMWDDTQSFVTILRCFADKSADNSENSCPSDIFDEALLVVLSVIPKYRPNVVEKLLHEYVAAGVSISPAVGEAAKGFFESQKAGELESTISALTSGELVRVPTDKYNPILQDKTGDYFKRPVGGSNVSDVRAQFTQYIDSKNEEMVLKTMKQLQVLGWQSPPVLAQALDLFCSTENIEAAERCYKTFKEDHGDAELDAQKTLNFAALMIKKDRFEDAMKILIQMPVLEDAEKYSRGLKIKVRKLLDTLADTQQLENTHQVFNLLKNKNYVMLDNYTLGPLVRIHVLRNEIDKAIETFERFTIEHKCTPYRNILTSILIDAEDASSLQKLTDLCTEIHGESNALVDLAFLFLEAGRPIQARKILETSGIQVFNEKIRNAVKHFDQHNRLECLDLLTHITRVVAKIDRGNLYNSVIEVWDKRNDCTKALALWTEMQEMNVHPTSYFINILNSLLTRNGQPVPFVTDNWETVPKTAEAESTPGEVQGKRRSFRIRRFVDEDKFNHVLNMEDWSAAENIIRYNNRERREAKNMYGKLIQSVLKSGNIDKAVELTQFVIQEFNGISKKVFSFVCADLIKRKKYETIEELEACLTEELKIDLDYYKIFSQSQIYKVGIRKYLEELTIDESGKNTSLIERKIHFGALFHALLADPDFVDDYEKWAMSLAEKKVDRGMQVLWDYYFIKNHKKADVLWLEYMLPYSSPLVRPIIEHGVEKKDPILLKKLLIKLESHPRLHIGTKCRAITGLIKIYNSLEQYEDGLKVLTEATKRFKLDLLSWDTLVELKAGLERSGKSFPFELEKEDGVESEVTEERLQGSGRV